MIPAASDFFRFDPTLLPSLGCLLAIAALIVLLLRAVIGGVVPSLRQEHRESTARRSWVELWLPLVAASPVAMSSFLLVPAAQRDGSFYAIWWGIGPLVAFAAALYGLMLVLSAPDPIRDAERADAANSEPPMCTQTRLRLGVVVLALGVIVSLMAVAGRLNAWHGQVLLTMGVVWMWLLSPARRSPRGASSPPVARSARRRVFFCLDWAQRLDRPVSILVRLGLVLCPVTFWLALSGLSTVTWWIDAVGLMAVLLPLAITVELARRVGVGDAERFLASTLVLAVLFGLGGHAIRMLRPMDTLWWVFDAPLSMGQPSVVMGVGVLLFVGLGLLGFGLLLLLRPPRTATFALSLSALALVGIALVVLASEPTGRVFALVRPVVHSLQGGSPTPSADPAGGSVVPGIQPDLSRWP